MTTTPNMNLSLPVEGPSGSVDVWGSLLNEIFDVIDAHDHSPGKGVRIKTNGIQIDADLSCASGGVGGFGALGRGTGGTGGNGGAGAPGITKVFAA